MSNFQFLRREFATLYKPANGAEQLVQSDPRAACFRIRHALERAVHWLYDYDRSLRRPYDRGLNALMTQPEFEALLPPLVYQKARLIQKQGNQAVHSARVIKAADDAQRPGRELLHTPCWFACAPFRRRAARTGVRQPFA